MHRTIKKKTPPLRKQKVTEGVDKKSVVILTKWWCPVCKKEYEYTGLELSGEGFGKYVGNYCMVCIAKRISETFPKLKEIKNEDKR